ncbi:MAG: ATP-binding cassette domain-containing protein [Rhodospirillales bacterium]|nr:ATP-binding cassette domain-containing protein [Rhodospirillales bacterium]
MSSEALIELKGVGKRFNGLAVVQDLGFSMQAGEILGLVGPNGSGKTTAINLISGVYAVDAGEIRLQGQRIERLAAFRRVHLGINRSFQVPKPFRAMTVAENVTVAAEFGGSKVDTKQILDDVGLAADRDRPAGALTVNHQKMLDLARALATSPKLLLVDEIGAGLNPGELASVADLLLALARRGIALIVVEHLLKFLNRITDRVIVLNAGRLLFEGTLAQASAHPEVVAAFLGG